MRVGYVGQENVPVGVAWCGIVHLETEANSFKALCNGRMLTMASEPEGILEDRGHVVTKLNICKRCQAKIAKTRLVSESNT